MKGCDKMKDYKENGSVIEITLDNEKVVKVTIELYPSDKDIIEKLQEQPSKQRYIKDLIRKDIQ